MAAPAESRIPKIGASSREPTKRRSLLPSPASHRNGSVNSSANSSINSSLSSSAHSTNSSSDTLEEPVASRTFSVGDSVTISGVKPGIVRYFGRTHFAEGYWCGIELDDSDGKHDGFIDGVRYFTCEDSYGIFAPCHKVEPGVKKRLISPSKDPVHQQNKQAQTSGLVKPGSVLNSKSASDKVVSVGGDSDIIKPVKQPSPTSRLPTVTSRPTSKLVQPRAIAKRAHPLSNKESSQQRSEKSTEKAAKPSRLPGLHKRSETFTKSPLEHEATYVTDKSSVDDEYDTSEPDVSTPSRVSPLTALTLTYDLHNSSGSDTERSDQCVPDDLSATYCLKSAKSLESPLLDFYPPCSVDDDGGEAMSDLEDDLDLGDTFDLADPTMSHASSLGILADGEVCENSLLAEDLKSMLRSDSQDTQNDSAEGLEADIEHEIDGISTPDMDMTSSTISGRSENERAELDATFLPTSTSTPVSPVKRTKTQEMDECDGSSVAMSISSTSDVMSVSCDMQTVEIATAAVTQYAQLVQNAEQNLAQIDKPVENCTSMTGESIFSKSDIEITDATLERIFSESDVEITDAPNATLFNEAPDATFVSNIHRDATFTSASHMGDSASSSVCEDYVVPSSQITCELTPTVSPSSVMASDVTSDILRGTPAGSTHRERPVSLISTCSVDTGIGSDLLSPRGRDRPLSMLSPCDSEHDFTPGGDDDVTLHDACSGSGDRSFDMDVDTSPDMQLSKTFQVQYKDDLKDTMHEDETLLDFAGTSRDESCDVLSLSETVLSPEVEDSQTEGNACVGNYLVTPTPDLLRDSGVDMLPPSSSLDPIMETSMDMSASMVEAFKPEVSAGMTFSLGDITQQTSSILITDSQMLESTLGLGTTHAVVCDGPVTVCHAASMDSSMTDETSSTHSNEDLRACASTFDLFTSGAHTLSELDCTTPVSKDVTLEPTIDSSAGSQLASQTASILITDSQMLDSSMDEDSRVCSDKAVSHDEDSLPAEISAPVKEDLTKENEMSKEKEVDTAVNSIDHTPEENRVAVEMLSTTTIQSQEDGVKPDVFTGENSSKTLEQANSDMDKEIGKEVLSCDNTEDIANADVASNNIVQSDQTEMSESTRKDAGPEEKGALNKEEEGERPKRKIDDSGKEAEMFASEEFLASSPKRPKDSKDKNSTGSKTAVKSKIQSKLDTGDKKTLTKKPVSKASLSVKKPAALKSKSTEDISDGGANSKVNKNATNKKKADMTPKEKATATSDALVKNRRISMPNIKTTVAPVARSSKPPGVSSVAETTEKKPAKPTVTKSKIDTNRDADKIKAKVEPKKRLTTASVKPGAVPARRTSLAEPKTKSTALRNQTGASGDSKAKETPRRTSITSRTSLAPPKLGSSQTSVDLNASRGSVRSTTSIRSAPAVRTSKTASKAGSLKATDRSPSVESQLSSISQVSSQGSRSQAKDTRLSVSDGARFVGRLKRGSVATVEAPPAKSTVESQRRASVAVSTRVASRLKKEEKPTSPAPPAAKRPATNQNRNKTTPKPAVPNTLKRSNQPDIVRGSVPNAKALQEVSRLEALCESRTKELQYAKMRLQQGLQGFDAMSVLVKYLTEQLNAFSCPLVTSQLKEARDRLHNAQLQLTDVQTEKERMEAEIKALREQWVKEKASLIADHRTETTSVEQRLRSEGEQAVHRVVERHSHEVTTLNNFHERSIANLKNEHKSALKDKDQAHRNEVKDVLTDQEKSLVDMQKQHETNLEEITMRFDNIKVTLAEKVEFLRAECDEMKRREKMYMDKCNVESDCKVQAALAPFRHLPAEIESMRAVLEMRNQELHELRRQKMDIEKKLEEIPVARDKILGLEQKVENLEAIITMKAEYEKQLTEKHQNLLRRLDRESKANKRLSMDNEELVYRLHVPSSPLPINSLDGPMHRSLTHSPPQRDTPAHMTRSLQHPLSDNGVVMRRSTVGAFSPPKHEGVVMRRHHSQSLRLDTSITESSKSSPTDSSENSEELSDNPPKSQMKRSGTYDLLDTLEQEAADDLQQSDV